METNPGPWPDVATARLFLKALVAKRPPVSGIPENLVQRLPPQLAPAIARWLVSHELGPLAHAISTEILPELAQHLKADQFSAAAENSIHFDNLRRIEAHFHAAGIPLLVLKGAALAEQAYPESVARVMSDVDIWLRHMDAARTCRLMQEIGFVLSSKADRPPHLQSLSDGEIRFHREGSAPRLVELHYGPLAGWWQKRTAAVDSDAMWSRKQPLASRGPNVYQLSSEDMVIQIAVHLAVNHQFGGPALRNLIDIHFTAQARPVDWLIVSERAQEWRVATAVWQVLFLVNQLLGLEDVDVAVERLRPSLLRRKLLALLVSPEAILNGIDLRRTRKRYLLQLLLVDRVRDMIKLIFRTLWPEKEWLAARYQGSENRWRHLWSVVRHGRI